MTETAPFKYDVMCDVDMSFVPSINDMVTSINKSMQGFGFEEKIGLHSKTAVYQITSSRLLLNPEKALIIQEVQKAFDKDDMLKKFKAVVLGIQAGFIRQLRKVRILLLPPNLHD